MDKLSKYSIKLQTGNKKITMGATSSMESDGLQPRRPSSQTLPASIRKVERRTEGNPFSTGSSSRSTQQNDSRPLGQQYTSTRAVSTAQHTRPMRQQTSPFQAQATASRIAETRGQNPFAAAPRMGEMSRTDNPYQRRKSEFTHNDQNNAPQNNQRRNRQFNHNPPGNNSRDLSENGNREPPRYNQNYGRTDRLNQKSNQFNQNAGENRENTHQRENQTRRGNNRNRGEVRHMGFRLLEDISKLDSFDALVKMQSCKDALRELLQSQLQPDYFALLLNILANICHSTFDDSKGHVLIEVCNSNFLANLQMYIMQLPYTSQHDKNRNKYYWSNHNPFWDNLLTFCETIILLSPSTALCKCRPIVEGAIGVSLKGLEGQHNFTVEENINERLEKLKKEYVLIEIKVEEEKKRERIDPQLLVIQEDESQPPPNNFRELSILPTVEDLLGQMPYVRPNIVNGGYINVDHYLDVQFRLLREDCYGPLREGIRQYLTDPMKKRFDNIRVHKDVTILEPYNSKDKIGILVQFEKIEDTGNKKQKKYQRRINWAHSKRFMFGSLLLFTQDNCKSFMLATVIDRDIKTLEKGFLPVALHGANVRSSADLFGKSFTMIESEVYFEPYYHVLKALQDPTFARHLAMSNYIVHVQPATNPPRYLTAASVYTVNVNDDGISKKTRFTVLNENSWPEPQELGLDRSQYEAYKLALTHEFSVIQGPPGTGKTYLGVLAARTLLENLKITGCTMLVICYTNHALDQFLEAILNITDSIVRIGGQSKSEVLKNHNLNQIRSLKSKTDRNSNLNKLFYEKKNVVQSFTNTNRNLQNSLDILNNGIVGIEVLRVLVNEAEVLSKFYIKRNEDAVLNWLFEDAERFYGGGDRQDEYDEDDEVPNVIDLDEDPNELILDEFDEDIELDVKNIFNVDNVKKNIRNWTRLLQESNSAQDANAFERLIYLWQARLKCYEDNQKLRSRNYQISITDRVHPNQFNLEERWAIYFKWLQTVKGKIIADLAALQVEHKSASDDYEEARMMMDRKLLEKTRVVGMTTTGAARLQKLIRSLQPPIVIVEEAAEVLESHIVVSLTQHCQHLILIGDHQQLRPSASHFKLAKHYNMEISLFERMITNGIHSRRLGVQHRMRPSIASLIVPAIYPELQNHDSVERYPPVRGLTANLFFLTHDKPEDAVAESSSRQNKFEADMILGLANYIMQQGYEPEDVTILAGYSGQMFYLRKQREQYNHLRNCKITVVDNYQGEESKIILLSLVRNNTDGNIGFMGIANRVCVALSRAKEGFYIMGNMDMLKNATDLWKTISESLERQAALGSSITLRCENHPDQITPVSELADFHKVPEGGCMLKCDINLSCSHPCPLICHAYDRGHSKVKCPRKCERVLCDLGHVCPLPCAKVCRPCMVEVKKQLPCGHQQMIQCHLDPNDPIVKCRTMVQATLPACQHKATKPCFVDVNSVPCPEPCIYRLPCGHACVNRCHMTKDPEHIHYNCEKPCPKRKNGCKAAELEGSDFGDHSCKKKCYEACGDCNVEVMKRRTDCTHRQRINCCIDINTVPCRQKCNRALPCGHFCNNKCHEPCGNCNKKVKKVLPICGHQVDVLCKDDPKPEDCRSRCERALPCGHKCTFLCNEQCSKAQCKELVSKGLKSPCGHLVHVPCYVYNKGLVSEEALLQHCASACNQTLSCEHVCSGTCGTCRQGRLHAPCTQPCKKTMLCGHECEEPCNEVCPPCKKQCEVRCAHTRCNRPCGQPCIPCQEHCACECPHGKCEKKCGDTCSQAPCDEPCPRDLPCGHRCRGLCGESCPDICKVCDPENFPKDFLGDDFDDDAKFIKLQDCKANNGHYMEVEDMDNMMKGDPEAVMIRACPYCRTPVINTLRYKDFVNATFRKEIDPIKRKVYGDEKDIKDRKDELYTKCERMFEKHKETITDNKMWETVLKKIRKFMFTKSLKMSLPELNMHAISLDILELLAASYEQYIEGNLKEFRPELTNQIAMICHALTVNTRKISMQQQNDINSEIKRTHAIVQLSKIMSNQSYAMGKGEPKVQNASLRAQGIVLTWETFNEEKARAALQYLQESVKLSGIVTKAERDLIVKAIGLKSGHWFKCPNGHIYCIGECGGAMQMSKCIECGTAIGGGSHRLLSDNRHAPEVDGSSYAAWSETANNMGNFQF